MAIELPPLPYEKNALEPHISAETLEFHYGKHHQAYVDQPQQADRGHRVRRRCRWRTSSASRRAAMFNNAAQVWNHTFYWNCLSPTAAASRPASWPMRSTRRSARSTSSRKQFSKIRRRQLRLRLGLAGAAPGWLARHRQHARTPATPITGSDKPLLTMRRVGTRLLHRLPQRPPEVRRGVLEPGELGIRGAATWPEPAFARLKKAAPAPGPLFLCASPERVPNTAAWSASAGGVARQPGCGTGDSRNLLAGRAAPAVAQDPTELARV